MTKVGLNSQILPNKAQNAWNGKKPTHFDPLMYSKGLLRADKRCYSRTMIVCIEAAYAPRKDLIAKKSLSV